MSWKLAKSLETLRKQINEKYPNRSKVSDGTIGDTAHSSRTSDHNPNSRGDVCAFDLTHDPKNGVDCNKIAAALITGRDKRIKYLIWNRQICSSVTAPWRWRTYTGSNPHTKHLHISVGNDYNNSTEWDLDLDAEKIYPNPEIVEFGDKGFAVSKAQTVLAELGFLDKTDVDGIFGRKTETAVKQFQKINNLTTDGIVGENTWTSLEALKK
jgi:hypothetical protein